MNRNVTIDGTEYTQTAVKLSDLKAGDRFRECGRVAIVVHLYSYIYPSGEVNRYRLHLNYRFEDSDLVRTMQLSSSLSMIKLEEEMPQWEKDLLAPPKTEDEVMVDKLTAAVMTLIKTKTAYNAAVKLGDETYEAAQVARRHLDALIEEVTK